MYKNERFLSFKKYKKIKIKETTFKNLNTKKPSRVKFSKYSIRKRNINKANRKKKKLIFVFSIFLNLLALLLFIISYHFYYLSLEKCLEGINLCTLKWNWIKTKIKQLIISVMIINFLLVLIIHKIISKFHLFHFIITFIRFYYYSHSAYYHDHGAFNIIFFFLFIFLFLLLLLIIKFIIFVLRIKYRYKLILTILLLFCYNLIINPTSCDDWAKGLNNTYIDNNSSKYGCRIVFPKNCDYKVIQFTQDISLLSFISCSNKIKNAKEVILKHSRSPYVNENTLKFGFPLTNNENGKRDGRDDSLFREYTFNNLLDMDKPLPLGFKKPEIIVDFSKDPYGELLINLNYDEELSKERKKLENNTIPYSDNILILYIDSISRGNTLRKLKKTIKFFEQFISYKGGYNKKYPNENFHSFQFFKYHAHIGYTVTNYPILFYGNKATANDFIRISKYIKENGYITSFAQDLCHKDNINTFHDLTQDELYDHQFLECDPNLNSFNSIFKRCLYGYVNSHHVYEYTNQFWRKYQNNRKFSLIIINDGHEGTLEVVKYSDDIIFNFLNSLYNDNLLKDTSVFFLSDHGCLMASVYYLNDFYQIESKLPMFFMIVNDRKNVDYNQQYFNIHENQQTFITGYDIYNTISNIIYGDHYINIKNKEDSHDTPKSPLGKSLFEQINQKERSPKNYENMDTSVCI